jgi:NADPH-dependent 2,4-dienoyl-CoA reductase/sulfur reductase-like enzyme
VAAVPSLDRIVVVGASLAGLRAVESLRGLGHVGALTLVGAEPHLPYDRPPLSKQLLAGEWEPGRVQLRSAEHLAGLGVELRLGEQAAALDLDARAVALAGGDRVPFDGLIVATGARPRMLPGAPDLEGLHTLRTLDDALAIREALDRGERLVVVGAGFIGSEVAATASTRGADVTLVEALPVPLGRVLGEEMGIRYAELHRRNGVDLRLGVGVEAIEGAEHVEEVRLSDGTTIEADLVVVGIGVQPNTEWLAGSELELDDGVVCDATLRAAPDVYAAGDVARWPHPLFGGLDRVEHWTNAAEQGHAAARNLLAGEDEAEPFGAVPYFWSDQHGSKLQLLGRAAGADELRVVHGDLDALRFVALYRRGERLLGAFTIDLAPRFVTYRALIQGGATWDEALEFAATVEDRAAS